ncbi:MAG TPA: hypothetical protein VGQ65_20560 [Thermoanaerobaculia bacterium]|jgi:hypothetical protein|nr:hypothetical protein [Thermoanaerobaculia bacterium]
MNIRNLSRIAVTALLFAAVVSVNAAPGTELFQTYFTGCGTLTEVGQSWHLCDGATGTTGTLTGDWREVDSTSCETFDTVTTYWEKCGSTWVQRTTLGACQCSH